MYKATMREDRSLDTDQNFHDYGRELKWIPHLMYKLCGIVFLLKSMLACFESYLDLAGYLLRSQFLV